MVCISTNYLGDSRLMYCFVTEIPKKEKTNQKGRQPKKTGSTSTVKNGILEAAAKKPKNEERSDEKVGTLYVTIACSDSSDNCYSDFGDQWSRCSSQLSQYSVY